MVAMWNVGLFCICICLNVQVIISQSNDTCTGVGNVVGFTATSDEVRQYGPGEVVQFSNIVHNFNGYDPTSGIFTCPDLGVYIFHVSVSVGDMDNLTTMTAQLMHNQRIVASVSTYTRGTFREHGSNLALVLCQAGDEVYVQAGPAGGTMANSEFGDSSFTGYQLKS